MAVLELIIASGKPVNGMHYNCISVSCGVLCHGHPMIPIFDVI